MLNMELIYMLYKLLSWSICINLLAQIYTLYE